MDTISRLHLCADTQRCCVQLLYVRHITFLDGFWVLNVSFRIIIKSLGFGLYETVLLDIPSSIFQIGSLILSGYIAGRFKNMRCVMMVR